MPTQIGRKCPFSVSRRITTGMFDTGSIRRPLISMRTMVASCRLRGEPPGQGIGEAPGDPGADVLPCLGSSGPLLQVNDAVAWRTSGRLATLVPALDQDFEVAPHERLVDRPLDDGLEVEQPRQPPGRDFLRHLDSGAPARGGGARARRVPEAEQAVEADLPDEVERGLEILIGLARE